MNSTLMKLHDGSRGQLFGLLISCVFSPAPGAKGNCPLAGLRNHLSTEEKYEYVMRLTNEEVECILLQHEDCYEKRLLDH